MPMEANSAAPTLGSGCTTCTGPGRYPGMVSRMPMRAMTSSSMAGSSLSGPLLP